MFYSKKLAESKINIKNSEKILYLGKKLLNQKWNLEKTLCFEKNLLLKSKMKTKYFVKKQTWKKIMN